MTFSSWGPGSSSPIIKRLIFFTSLIATLSATLQSIFEHFTLFPGPQSIISLSWWGIGNWFLWQPLTYLFTLDSAYSLSFTFFINLVFTMYVLWIIGTPLIDLIGKRPFMRLYFISGIAAGLIALASMPLTGQYTFLAGPTASILAVITVWSLAFPEAEILLFFLIPVKAKWLVATIIALVLLNTLSQWNLSYFVLYLFGILIGYGYATIAWGWHSPFPHTQRMDRALAAFGLKLRQYTPHWKRRANIQKENKKEKIVDIKTGKRPLDDDDAFVDAMLTKISKHGEQSLSWSERRRLDQIAEKKNR